MEAAAIIAIIAKVIEVAVKVGPTVIKTIEDASPFAKVIYDQIVNKKVISQDDLDELEAQLTALSEELQQPLPPE